MEASQVNQKWVKDQTDPTEDPPGLSKTFSCSSAAFVLTCYGCSFDLILIGYLKNILIVAVSHQAWGWNPASQWNSKSSQSLAFFLIKEKLSNMNTVLPVTRCNITLNAIMFLGFMSISLPGGKLYCSTVALSQLRRWFPILVSFRY